MNQQTRIFKVTTVNTHMDLMNGWQSQLINETIKMNQMEILELKIIKSEIKKVT